MVWDVQYYHTSFSVSQGNEAEEEDNREELHQSTSRQQTGEKRRDLYKEKVFLEISEEY